MRTESPSISILTSHKYPYVIPCTSRRVASRTRLENESESGPDDGDDGCHSDVVESGTRPGRGGSGGSGSSGRRGRDGSGGGCSGTSSGGNAGRWGKSSVSVEGGERGRSRTVSGESANVDGVTSGGTALETELEGGCNVRRSTGCERAKRGVNTGMWG